MAINNIEGGRQFAKAARAVLEKDLSATDSTHWFTLEDMLEVADKFNIFGVFNSDYNHWRLVLKINEDGSLRVYDPLYDQDGNHVYDYKPPESSVSMLSRALQKHLQIDGADLFKPEKDRLEMLKEKGYELQLPENFRNESLQDDGHNCGPLALYAALVANKYTPDFRDKADFAELRAVSGIEII